MDQNTGKRLLRLKGQIVEKFKAEHWRELGLITGTSDVINGHRRLLRSLDFGDPDYSGNVIEVLETFYHRDPALLGAIERYLDDGFDIPGEDESGRKAEKIRVSPKVFEVPKVPREDDLVSVMMPFDLSFNNVYKSITTAASNVRMRCARADDIWNHSVVIQDVFELIYRSRIVVVDFSNRNPNVMYETGIAHTLGRDVVPISQSLEHVPFDLRHHRVLVYLANNEGLKTLEARLEERLGVILHSEG